MDSSLKEYAPEALISTVWLPAEVYVCVSVLLYFSSRPSPHLTMPERLLPVKEGTRKVGFVCLMTNVCERLGS